jgi:hypothetical protein
VRVLADRLPSVLDGSEVAALDPLGADAIYQRLPEMNREADVNEIAKAVRAITPSAEAVERMSMIETCAATRDVGILLGSLRRHGVEPTEAVPEVEAPMLRMAMRTEMVPRETLFHTSVWNERGPRQRMFTGDRNEDVLLEATRMGAICVERMLLALLPVLDVPFEDPAFTTGCAAVAREAGAMVDAVDYTRNNMDPVFFARVQRPYYEPIVLGGKQYSGAAAAALSIGVVDHLLWASDCTDETYRHFQDDTVRYAKPCWRQLCQDTLGQPSVVTLLRARLLEGGRDVQPRVTEACAGVCAILRTMLKFRGRHRLLAQSAYDASVRLFELGSAGYGIDTLEHVIELTHRSSGLVAHPASISGGAPSRNSPMEQAQTATMGPETPRRRS